MVLILLILNFSHIDITFFLKIVDSLVFYFVDQPNYENHKNEYPTNINETTVNVL